MQIQTKLLPEVFARNYGRMVRFEREAKVLVAIRRLKLSYWMIVVARRPRSPYTAF
jgi:hypothetical protein